MWESTVNKQIFRLFCLFVFRGDAETSSLLETWRIINLMRVLGAVLGWVLVSVQPTKDYTARKWTFT